MHTPSTPPPFILMIDDVSENLQVLGKILKEAGYYATPAISGAQALKIVEKRLPDLILLDIMMPEMDGYEVCDALKSSEATREIPVIFLSAKTETDDVIKGFDLGAVDYVTKPFRKEELLARVKTHLSLRQARRELQELNAAKDKFFSIIAHDLRSPFNSFLGMTELFLENIMSYSPEKIADTLRKQLKAAKNLFALLENLLSWARIQRGVMEYSPQSISLDALVDENVSLLQSGAERKQIALRNRLPAQTQVYADYNMVNTILRNLVSNALKFTEAGGSIELSATQGDRLIEICVADTGVGMPSEALDSLFRIDVKYSQVGTDGERGTGLGLILCKELVERQGGSMWVESEVGKGTTFRFTLPKQDTTSFERTTRS